MPITSDQVEKMKAKYKAEKKAKYKAEKELESLRKTYPHNFDKVIGQFKSDDPPSLPIFCRKSIANIGQTNTYVVFGGMHITMKDPNQDPPQSLQELFKLKNEEKLTVMHQNQDITSSDLEIITRCKQALGTIENLTVFADKYPAPGDL